MCYWSNHGYRFWRGSYLPDKCTKLFRSVKHSLCVEEKMIIDCIADLHGHYPKLEGGDLLIVAGDLTARHTRDEFYDFARWMNNQEYEDKIVVPGNHDTWLKDEDLWYVKNWITVGEFEYLCDDGTELENGIKIWGSPWTKTFEGMNPHCKAFTCDTEDELASKFSLIPKDIDILITHSPAYGVLDDVEYRKNGEDVHKGSEALIKPLVQSKCSLHIFGHVHEAYGKYANPLNGIIYVNASHVNEHYQPVNKPIRVIL